MKKFNSISALIPLILILSTPAVSAVVVDNSPDVLGAPIPGFTAQNDDSAQNFLANFMLSQATTITGIDIYSDFGASLGTAVTIKLRDDLSGTPSTINSNIFSSVISAIDSNGSSANPSILRLHADFTATALSSGSYWIGMSGTGTEIGWNIGFGAPGPDVWQLSQDNLQFSFNGNSAFAFRVYGAATSSPTPEPSSWAMMIVGLGTVGSTMRNRRKARASAFA